MFGGNIDAPGRDLRELFGIDRERFSKRLSADVIINGVWSNSLNMHTFSKTYRLGLLVMVVAVASVRAQVKIPDEQKVGGFAVGCQAYTFNRFSVFEAIEKTDQAGGRSVEFFTGQKQSKEEPNVKFDHNTACEVIE